MFFMSSTGNLMEFPAIWFVLQESLYFTCCRCHFCQSGHFFSIGILYFHV